MVSVLKKNKKSMVYHAEKKIVQLGGNKAMKWMKYLSIGAFMVGWLTKAVKDGVITQDEIHDLIMGIIEKLGLGEIKILK